MWRTPALTSLAILAVLVLAVGFLRRPAPTPEEGVRAAIEQFIEGVETRRIQDAVRTLAPDFTWEGATRGEVSRGMLVLNRDYDSVNIILVALDIQEAPSGDRATAILQVAVSAWQNGRELAVGVDQPVVVTVTYQRHGRRWLARQAEGGRSLHYFGYR